MDSAKTYYTRSGSEGAHTYTAMASPTKANLGTYYEMASAADRDINFMVVEKSAAIKFDRHIASRIFSLDELQW